jgi:ribosomal protein S18 acetylase RimI-like enzyme
MKLKIRKALEKDLEKISEILTKTWDDTYKNILPPEVISHIKSNWHNKENLKKQLNSNSILFNMIEIDDISIGIITVKIKNKDFHLSRLYILPEFQGKGIGKYAINHLIDNYEIDKITLDVEVSNQNAINFYKKLGFNIDRSDSMNINAFELDTYFMIMKSR